MRRRITKQLTCPACGVVIAEATYRRFPSNLDLTGADGAYMAPETAGTQERRMQTAIAEAASPAEQQRARDRLEFVKPASRSGGPPGPRPTRRAAPP